MIVDTSALIAILLREPGHQMLLDALESEAARLPAPAKLEFLRVASTRLRAGEQAKAILAEWEDGGLDIIAFDRHHADAAVAANDHYGMGNGRGGSLNLLDLMVYAIAKVVGEPLLCAGKDFATTDLVLHPASQVERT